MEKFYNTVIQTDEYKHIVDTFSRSLQEPKDMIIMKNSIKDLKLKMAMDYIERLERLGKNVGADLDTLDTQMSLDHSIVSVSTLQNIQDDKMKIKKLEEYLARYKRIAHEEHMRCKMLENRSWWSWLFGSK